MASPQALSETDRRTVAAWAADCVERVLPLFEAESPDDDRPRDAIARARAFARGKLEAAALAAPDRPEVFDDELRWQLAHMSSDVRDALRRLPRLGEDSAGPLGSGLLATGVLGEAIRALQRGLDNASPTQA